jgi:hypothetical protein
MRVCWRALIGVVAGGAAVGALGCHRATAIAEGGGTDGGAAAGGPFEGIVRLRVPGITEDDAVAFEIKGAHVRWNLSVEAGRAGGYRVFDASARRLFTVSPEQSAVAVDDIPPPRSVAAVPWAFTDLGTGKTAGYPCQRSRVTDGFQAFVVCSASLPIPLEYAIPNVTASVHFLAELEAKGELPLAVAPEPPDAQAARGPRLASPKLFAAEVRATPVDDSRFVIPDFPVIRGHAATPPRALPR